MKAEARLLTNPATDGDATADIPATKIAPRQCQNRAPPLTMQATHEP
jgi:hypothetical protein